MQTNEHKNVKKADFGLKRKIIILALKVLSFILLVYILLFRLFGFVRIENNLMKPSIYGGDLTLIYRISNEFEVGDVVIYTRDGEEYIGRILAKSGDTVSLENDAFMINGGHDSSTYYGENVFPEISNISYPYTLEEGQLFIVGDNRSEYQDSRNFGGIFESEIEGKVIGVFRVHAI